LPPVTVPAHKPIKPIYIMRFLALIAQIGKDAFGEDNGD
jgi:hypothetical protein